MLDLNPERQPTSRLSCQIIYTDALTARRHGPEFRAKPLGRLGFPGLSKPPCSAEGPATAGARSGACGRSCRQQTKGATGFRHLSGRLSAGAHACIARGAKAQGAGPAGLATAGGPRQARINTGTEAQEGGRHTSVPPESHRQGSHGLFRIQIGLIDVLENDDGGPRPKSTPVLGRQGCALQ